MECETKQRLKETPVFEVECECLSTEAYREFKNETMDGLILALLMKLLDFYIIATNDLTVTNMDKLIHSLTLIHH
jgi:hypothetical protein